MEIKTLDELSNLWLRSFGTDNQEREWSAKWVRVDDLIEILKVKYAICEQIRGRPSTFEMNIIYDLINELERS